MSPIIPRYAVCTAYTCPAKLPAPYRSLLFALVQPEERRLVLPAHAYPLDAPDLGHERRAALAELVGVRAASEEVGEQERARARRLGGREQARGAVVLLDALLFDVAVVDAVEAADVCVVLGLVCRSGHRAEST